MSSEEVLVSLLNRKVSDLRSINALLVDERSRLLAERLRNFDLVVRQIDQLINPVVEVSHKSLDEFTLASAHKHYYMSERNEVVRLLSRFIEQFLLISDVLFQADPSVESETELTKNLQVAYKSFLDLNEKVSTNLVALCDSTRYSFEVLQQSGALQNAWNNLKLSANHLVTVPLKASIVEEARREVIGRLREEKKRQSQETSLKKKPD
jgi:hypothetical protein